MELRSILTSTKVGELLLATRATLLPSDSVSQAAEEMRTESHGSVAVCDEGKLIGIFTERDLLGVIAGGGSMEMLLSEVMTADPQTVTVDDTLFEAVRRMVEGGYRRLPVVDSSGAPEGIVDVKTITHFLVEHFPAAVYNQAPHDSTIAKNREGA